ncbi:hypothetical protein FACS189474_3320 [Bacteroidia bacterium]|nr:hypothetical protein FACS189474_3320 [Bacteroidia bacterium]
MVKSDKKLIYTIDDNIDYIIQALFPFVDKDGKKYLTFQNRSQSEILFYEIDSPDCLFRLKIEREGPDGVPALLGYHIKNLDEIYLTSVGIPQITKVDSTGKILQKIMYGKTDEGKDLVPTFSSKLMSYTPLVIIDNKFYFTQNPMPGKTIETWPVSGYVDTTTNSVKALPLTFPPLIDSDEIYTTGLGAEFAFSRCFNGSDFVYSFYFQDDIIIASPDHNQIRYIQTKSKYMDKINDLHEKRPSDALLGAKRLCEAPFYGNLLYDNYRNIYYRVVYPETEMEDNENYIELWQSGRKRFSIIILDKDFNIIGETLFPDYTYKSMVMFVEKDGLYICDSHVKNPEFDEDILSFQCFELSKK